MSWTRPCPWAEPASVVLDQVQVDAGGFTDVAQALGRRHSCHVHIAVPGTSWDGAVVQLYALAGNVRSLVSWATIGAATLQTTLDSAGLVTGRSGLICGVTNTMCDGFAVRVVNAVPLEGASVTLEVWGQ